MLVFITSIRHPWNCHSYERVGVLLGISLRSVVSQRDRNFEVIVVCNKKPPGAFPPDVHWVEVNFPPPSPTKSPVTGLGAIHLDRGAKYAVGLAYAKRFSPEHVMFFDADDLVSNRLCELVHGARDRSCGWLICEGYQIRYGAEEAKPTSNFYRYCGTSVIHPEWAVPVPDQLSDESSLDNVIDWVDPHQLQRILGAHRFAKHHYEEVHRRPLEPVPFPGAIWVLGTGENHSGKSSVKPGIEVGSDLIEEFSIPQPWPRLNSLAG